MAHKSPGPKVTEVLCPDYLSLGVKMWSGNEAIEVTFGGTVTQSGHKQGRL